MSGEADHRDLLVATMSMANAELAKADAAGQLAAALLDLELACQHSLSGIDPTLFLAEVQR